MRVVEIIVDQGAEISLKNMRDETPLHLAARAGFFNIVEYLVDCGAVFNTENIDGVSPKQEALKKGYTDIVSLFESLNA